MVCILTSLARASPVTFEFAGEITGVFDPDNLLQGAVVIGSPFSGGYTFESTTADSQPHPSQGVYDGSILSISGQVGTLTFYGPVGGRNSIEVRDESLGADSYAVRPDVLFAGVDLDLLLYVADPTAGALPGDQLLLVPPDLSLFTQTDFGIWDASEQIPLGLSGRITSIVPEPLTAALLAVGALALRRKRCVRPSSRTGALPFLLVLASVSVPFMQRAVFAADCNRNGALDSDELAMCKADLVFLFDTSGSMRDFILGLCNSISAATLSLAAGSPSVDVIAEIRRIAPGGEMAVPCSCCAVDAATIAYGTAAPWVSSVLGTCGSQPGQSDEADREDWAPAVAIAASRKLWRPGAVRMVFPISDEGPRCGDPIHDPGADRDAVRNAGCVAADHGVRTVVAPLINPQLDPALQPLAEGMAAGGAPGGRVLDFTGPDLAQRIVALVREQCPKDCNGNGAIDFCDIENGASKDCTSGTSSCCLIHPQPGCDDLDENQDIEACVCDEFFGDPTCCSSAWTFSCVDRAVNSCGFICPQLPPDRIPDECQLSLSADCDFFGTPDACDLSCAGACNYFVCGTKTDCNNNCVPDECDLQQCSPEKPGFCDCNENGSLDSCDVLGGVSCDVDEDGRPDECGVCCLPDATCLPAVFQTCPLSVGFFHAGVRCEECSCLAFGCCLPTTSTCTTQDAQGNFMAECECREIGGTPVPSCPSNLCNVGACCYTNGACQDTAVPSVPCSPLITDSCMTEAQCENPDNPGALYFGGAKCTDEPHPCRDVRPRSEPVSVPCWSEGFQKDRVISFVAGNAGAGTAIRVTLTNVAGFPQRNGQVMWVGPPQSVCEASGKGPEEGCIEGYPSFTAAQLGCAQHCRDWSTLGTIHAYGRAIIPGSHYKVEVVPCCGEGNPARVSFPLDIFTTRYGDITNNAPLRPCPLFDCWPAPSLSEPPAPANPVGVTTDVVARLGKFANRTGSPIKARADMQGTTEHPVLDLKVNIDDVTRALDAFRGGQYPFTVEPLPPC